MLGEVLYFNASAVKLRTFLHPDQHRDLERVLLVTPVIATRRADMPVDK